MTGTGHRDIFRARSEKVKNYFVRRGSRFKILCNRNQVFMIIRDTKIDKSVKDVKAFFHRIRNHELADKEYDIICCFHSSLKKRNPECRTQ